jgi:phosphoribosyl 1,2-cyclic phosphodiesterase
VYNGPVSLQITSLASGSSGNAFLVQTASGALLVEAGLTARALERHLRQRGVDPATLAGIVVSHEHFDHAQGAGTLARRYGLPIVCSAGTARAMGSEWAGLDIRKLDEEGMALREFDLWGFPLPHDAAEPLGILLSADGATAGWALDLGHVPEGLAAILAHADLVVIEANHDRERLIAAPYPWSTKHRIMSPTGHLSNMEAAELLAAIGADGRRRVVWLAHLSERANDHPKGVLRIVETYLEMAGIKNLVIEIAERNRPSVVWPSERTLLQRALFDGM